jgi:putative restriction endonuclease
MKVIYLKDGGLLMMDADELKDKIRKLSVWKKGEQRAPHKPLLILYALGRLQNEKIKELPYEEIRVKLANLLKEYGPSRKSYHPEQPFVRLGNDGIWQLDRSVERHQINDKFLLKNNVVGGFSNQVYSLLLNIPQLIPELAELILNEHFPESMHEDILIEVGLNVGITKSRTRDPMFREKILRAYEYNCAVCGFNIRLGNTLVAVEAAHIKWHQAGGPDQEENGIALCSLHHKLFDRGVFTLNESREILVSEAAHGNKGFDEWLMKYHGKRVRLPISPDYQPSEIFINWHVKEVFRGKARYLYI